MPADPTCDRALSRVDSLYFAAEVAHDKDYLAASVAYTLGLTGPAETVQTSCSSSLVALVRGVHAIRLGLCDSAICGGVSLQPDLPVKIVDGMIWSPNGTCKPFPERISKD